MESTVYYYDHQAEIEAELAANTQEVVLSQLFTPLVTEWFLIGLSKSSFDLSKTLPRIYFS